MNQRGESRKYRKIFSRDDITLLQSDSRSDTQPSQSGNNDKYE